MAANSKIEWTEHTFNPWWGCTKVSPACDNCYAEAWAKRTGHSVWGHRAERRSLSDNNWQQPLKWNRVAMETGKRARVFCASMADVFEWNSVLNQSRDRLWDLIDQTPALDWLLLTKRPHLVNRLAPWRNNWPHNVWIGTTAENQKWADKRMKHLACIPARIRFISCEPLLDHIDLTRWLHSGSLDWVIAGGESGPRARASNPAWFRSLRNQCAKHDVAFLFKQWGDWKPEGDGTSMKRIGKKKAGRILDGRTWDTVPIVSV